MQDFDWADEVLHSQIGRQWYVPEFGSLQKALDYGDAAWSKVLSNWATVKEQGLTEHDELVAGGVRAGVRRRGRAARPRGAGVRRDVRRAAGGLAADRGGVRCATWFVREASPFHAIF